MFHRSEFILILEMEESVMMLCIYVQGAKVIGQYEIDNIIVHKLVTEVILDTSCHAHSEHHQNLAWSWPRRRLAFCSSWSRTLCSSACCPRRSEISAIYLYLYLRLLRLTLFLSYSLKAASTSVLLILLPVLMEADTISVLLM